MMIATPVWAFAATTPAVNCVTSLDRAEQRYRAHLDLKNSASVEALPFPASIASHPLERLEELKEQFILEKIQTPIPDNAVYDLLCIGTGPIAVSEVAGAREASETRGIDLKIAFVSAAEDPTQLSPIFRDFTLEQKKAGAINQTFVRQSVALPDQNPLNSAHLIGMDALDMSGRDHSQNLATYNTLNTFFANNDLEIRQRIEQVIYHPPAEVDGKNIRARWEVKKRNTASGVVTTLWANALLHAPGVSAPFRGDLKTYFKDSATDAWATQQIQNFRLGKTVDGPMVINGEDFMGLTPQQVKDRLGGAKRIAVFGLGYTGAQLVRQKLPHDAGTQIFYVGPRINFRGENNPALRDQEQRVAQEITQEKNSRWIKSYVDHIEKVWDPSIHSEAIKVYPADGSDPFIVDAYVLASTTPFQIDQMYQSPLRDTGVKFPVSRSWDPDVQSVQGVGRSIELNTPGFEPGFGMLVGAGSVEVPATLDPDPKTAKTYISAEQKANSPDNATDQSLQVMRYRVRAASYALANHLIDSLEQNPQLRNIQQANSPQRPSGPQLTMVHSDSAPAPTYLHHPGALSADFEPGRFKPKVFQSLLSLQLGRRLAQFSGRGIGTNPPGEITLTFNSAVDAVTHDPLASVVVEGADLGSQQLLIATLDDPEIVEYVNAITTNSGGPFEVPLKFRSDGTLDFDALRVRLPVNRLLASLHQSQSEDRTSTPELNKIYGDFATQTPVTLSLGYHVDDIASTGPRIDKLYKDAQGRPRRPTDDELRDYYGNWAAALQTQLVDDRKAILEFFKNRHPGENIEITMPEVKPGSGAVFYIASRLNPNTGKRENLEVLQIYRPDNWEGALRWLQGYDAISTEDRGFMRAPLEVGRASQGPADVNPSIYILTEAAQGENFGSSKSALSLDAVDSAVRSMAAIHGRSEERGDALSPRFVQEKLAGLVRIQNQLQELKVSGGLSPQTSPRYALLAKQGFQPSPIWMGRTHGSLFYPTPDGSSIQSNLWIESAPSLAQVTGFIRCGEYGNRADTALELFDFIKNMERLARNQGLTFDEIRQRQIKALSVYASARNIKNADMKSGLLPMVLNESASDSEINQTQIDIELKKWSDLIDAAYSA